MRRLFLALLTVGLVAAQTAPASAAPEAGTVEMTGLIVYSTSGSTSSITFVAAPCIHTAAPDPEDPIGWICNDSFILSDTTPVGTFFNLTGSWRSGSRTYYLSLSLLDAMAPGPHAATGSVTVGGRSGTATFDFVSTPHADANKDSYIGAVEYLIPG